MTKARRELAARMTTQDLVVEVLDARLPAASANPLITELRGERPCLKILTRSDLADPAQTAAWVRHLEATGGGAVTAFAATTRQADDTRRRFAEALAGGAWCRRRASRCGCWWPASPTSASRRS
jgi:ribosome biogenesis GTPase A